MTFEDYLANSTEMDREGFAPIGFVSGIPADHFQGALAFVYCSGLKGRWDIEKNDAGTYDFSFEDKDDATAFEVFL